jgi:hypothetical protein
MRANISSLPPSLTLRGVRVLNSSQMKAVFVKQSDSKKSFIYEAKRELEIVVDGKKKKVNSSQSIRIYAEFKCKSIEVTMEQLTPMKLQDKTTSTNMFWL